MVDECPLRTCGRSDGYKKDHTCNYMYRVYRMQHYLQNYSLLILPTHVHPLESTLSLLSAELLLLLLVIHHVQLRIHPHSLPDSRLPLHSWLRLSLLCRLWSNLCHLITGRIDKTHNLPIFPFIKIERIEIIFQR